MGAANATPFTRPTQSRRHIAPSLILANRSPASRLQAAAPHVAVLRGAHEPTGQVQHRVIHKVPPLRARARLRLILLSCDWWLRLTSALTDRQPDHVALV